MGYMSADSSYGEYYKKFFEDYYTQESGNKAEHHENAFDSLNDKIIDIKIDDSKNLVIVYKDDKNNVYEKILGTVGSSDSKLTHVHENEDSSLTLSYGDNKYLKTSCLKGD